MIEAHFLPDDKKVQVRPGTTLMEAARKAKLHIRSRCAGNAGCLMCKVIVRGTEEPIPISQNESLKLGALVEQGYRLACQARIYGNVTVELPEDPLKAAVRAQLAKQKEEEEW